MSLVVIFLIFLKKLFGKSKNMLTFVTLKGNKRTYLPGDKGLSNNKLKSYTIMTNFYTQSVKDVLEQVTAILEKYENGDSLDKEAKGAEQIIQANKIKRDAAFDLMYKMYDLVTLVNDIYEREGFISLRLTQNAR